MPGSSGNRVATVLTVLENPEAGGATIWPYAGISVFGKKGSGIFWHNLRKSDAPDLYTQHAACPVLLGMDFLIYGHIGHLTLYQKSFNNKKSGQI